MYVFQSDIISPLDICHEFGCGDDANAWENQQERNS